MSAKSFQESLLLVLMVFIVITAFWGTHKLLLLSVGVSFLVGLLVGVFLDGFSQGLFPGILYGLILALFVAILGLCTRYFRERSRA
jgi:hypothetical protein